MKTRNYVSVLISSSLITGCSFFGDHSDININRSILWENASLNLGSQGVGTTQFTTIYLTNLASETLNGCRQVELTDVINFSVDDTDCTSDSMLSGQKCFVKIASHPTTIGEKKVFLKRQCIADNISQLAEVEITTTGLISFMNAHFREMYLNEKVYSHSSTSLQGGAGVLIAGGYNGDPSNVVQFYNETSGYVQLLAPMQTARSSFTLTTLQNGKVLAVGGYGTWMTGALSSVELYDPVNNTWSPAASLPLALYNHKSILLSDGRVLVSGGLSNHSGTYIYNPNTDAWSQVANMTIGRNSHFLGLIGTDKVIAVAGEIGVSGTDSVEIYDIGLNTWTPAASLTVSRRQFDGTTLSDGRILIAGGLTDNGSPTSVEIYNPNTNIWTNAGSLNIGRRELKLKLLSDGKVLAVGGGTPGTSTVEMYNPNTDSWSLMSNLNTPRTMHTLEVLSNGQVIVIAGMDDNWQGTNTFELYNPTTNIWTQQTQLAPKRFNHQSISLNDGRVLTIGGDSDQPNKSSLYDPLGNTWTTNSTLLDFNRTAFTITKLNDGRVLVTGGADGMTYLDSVEIYNPLDDTWTPAQSLNVARCLHTATKLNDGRVLVAGGYNNSGDLSSVEIYNPTDDTWSIVSDLSETRYNHQSITLDDGKVLVVGGRANPMALSPYLDNAELYNPTNNTWVSAGSTSIGTEGHTLTKTSDGRVFIIGGYDTNICRRGQTCYDMKNRIEEYDTNTQTWSAKATPPADIGSHTATVLADNRIVVIGGGVDAMNFVGPTASVLIYNPTTDQWTTENPLTDARIYHSATLLNNGKILVYGGMGLRFNSLWFWELLTF